MAKVRSFKEYVKYKLDNRLWKAVEEFLREVPEESLELRLKKVRVIGEMELDDTDIQFIDIKELDGNKIDFDVVINAALIVHDADRYHNDETDYLYQWFSIRCTGDLDCGLDDAKIISVDSYSTAKRRRSELDDQLIPYMPTEAMEREAQGFLKRYYPEALKITCAGEPPIYVDPVELARRLGLEVKTQRITEDSSVFGRLFFAATDTEMYSSTSEHMELVHVNAKTIVVDPEVFLLGNLGKSNNTVIHECVHWAKHYKAFLLEQLYNENASSISCEVVGGARSEMNSRSLGHMERQANSLTPKIQMPAAPFKAKAKEYITKFIRESGARHEIDVMEAVILALHSEFMVSKQAAKIRLVELGFETAIGTFTFIDDHYVRPHSFKKGAITKKQTFSIGEWDAAIQRKINPALNSLTQDGDYLFVENHFVFNTPLYVERDAAGRSQLTDYARSHMDECCLVFDMKIVGDIHEEYHTVCYLNREQGNFKFDITYCGKYEYYTPEKQVEMRQKEQAQAIEIRRKMTDDPEQCMELLLGWRGMNYTELASEIALNPETISRTVKGKTSPKINTVALICFGLQLPPAISIKLLDVLDCRLSPTKLEHQWIDEALHIKYTEPIDAIREYLAQYGVTL